MHERFSSGNEDLGSLMNLYSINEVLQQEINRKIELLCARYGHTPLGDDEEMKGNFEESNCFQRLILEFHLWRNL